MPFAHSLNCRGHRHDLVEHLRAVAELAGRFSAPLSAEDIAYYLGLWHDLGKFCPAFQAYLDQCEEEPERSHRRVDHKAAGSTLAREYIGDPAAMVLQGHHGGIRDQSGFQSWYQERLDDPATNQALNLARATIADLEPIAQLQLPTHVERDALAAELWTRLVFSALVDADFLDTERHFVPERADRRETNPSIEQLWALFERDQARVSGHAHDTVSRVRHDVYQACLRAADAPAGMFRLTVPTGGERHDRDWPSRSGMRSLTATGESS